MDCGNSYHDKCADSVPKNCTKYKTVEGVQQTLNRSQGDNGSIASSANAGQASSQQIFDQFGSHVAENRTHEGYEIVNKFFFFSSNKLFIRYIL